MRSILTPIVAVTATMTAIASGALAACGADADGPSGGGDDRPTIVVTMSVWGDIVSDAFGGFADVDVIVPAGADPHDFSPSAREAERMENADLVVVNGFGLEAGMASIVDSVAATGTPVVTLADHLPPLDDAAGAAGGGGPPNPHIWLDPTRVASVVEGLGGALAELTSVDPETIAAATAAATERLDRLDADIAATLDPIPADRRLLVTNHDAFEYFAERYGFEVVGTIIPSNSTSAAASAADLVALADLIDELAVPAIFAETTEPDELARSLAAELSETVAVVELYSESLGPPGSGADTYRGMMLTNAQRIAAALTPS